MKSLKTFRLILLSLLLISFFGCNDSDSESNAASLEAPTISIRLADTPGDFEKVNIDVIDVMIKMNDDSNDDNGWQSLDPINTGVHDLLELTGGLNVLLVDRFQIPAGELSQIRLVLGENNTVVIEGEEGETSEEVDLKTPSAQQSGLKIKVNEELLPGFTYDFLLDFDVDKSIVIAGNSGNIILKPVIRASAIATSGIIEGNVSPSNIQTLAYVVLDDMGTPETEDDEIISAYTDENGHFALWGVPGGTYVVILSPDSESDYEETMVEDVIVVNGEITNIDPDPIQLNLKRGSITGTITNAGIVATATVMVNGEEVSDETDENGVFLLENIPVGIYTVTITPVTVTDPPLNSTNVENVEVLANTITTITPDVTLLP